MNGVITRLVLRALPAPSGGIRPRLPGRFEHAWAPAQGDAGTEAYDMQNVPRRNAPSPWREHEPRIDHAVGESDAAYTPSRALHAATIRTQPPPAIDAAPRVPAEVTAARVAAAAPDTPTAGMRATPPAPVTAGPTPTPPPPLVPMPAPLPFAFPLSAQPPIPPLAVPAAAAREPDVEISIGRIEVRTPQARKPERAPRAQPKLMSLEDYLSRGRRPR